MPFAPPIRPVTRDPNDASLSPFCDACRSGDLEQVIQFVESHERHENYLRRGLVYSVMGSHATISQYLLEKGALIDVIVMMYSLACRCLGIFQALHEHGWDVNEPCIKGITILSEVVDDEPLVRWLLQRGADPNIGKPLMTAGRDDKPDPESSATLDAVGRKGSVAVLNLLIEHGLRLDRGTPLHFAAGSYSCTDGEQIPMVARLIELGFDANADDLPQGPYRKGRPLAWAADQGHFETFKFLLDNGADLNVPGIDALLRYPGVRIIPEFVEFLERSKIQ